MKENKTMWPPENYGRLITLQTLSPGRSEWLTDGKITFFERLLRNTVMAGVMSPHNATQPHISLPINARNINALWQNYTSFGKTLK